MNILKTSILTAFMLISALVFSQEAGYKTAKTATISKDSTLNIDSLSIVPGSLIIKDTSGKPVPLHFFHIDYPGAKISLLNDSALLTSSYPYFELHYQTFGFDIGKIFYNKTLSTYQTEKNTNFYPIIRKNENSYESYIPGDLIRAGSISRGISIGNNQDMSVSSGLNLQLSGKLSKDVSILAAITDKNIPIQPDGTTLQIQEFDKVFIKIMTEKSTLTAGDFEINKLSSNFMRFNKKAQGGQFSTSFLQNKKSGDTTIYDISISAALAKGKYSRNQIIGIEGNQGPYKLRGGNNEHYIIILAGSEKIYLDGQLLTRGSNNDYIIDYNTAELTFTPKHLITRDKRIIAEFEYSDRNYARSMLYADASYTEKNIKINTSFYSEQDHRNQTLLQDLSNEQKLILINAGDNFQSAFVPNVETTEFSNNEVLYKLADTIVGGITYDSIYIFSTNPDSARYRLRFSELGAGKGNYVQITSPVNGRVFKWVAPANNIPQGTWEPVISLVAPRTQKMGVVSAEIKIGTNTITGLETAFSILDKNTFSSYNNRDNKGSALKVFAKNTMYLTTEKSAGWSVNSTASYEFESKYFSPIERYREAEFNRDWNMFSTNYGFLQLPSFQLEFKLPKTAEAGYQLSALLTENAYSAFKHKLYGNLNNKKTHFSFNTGFLNGSDPDNNFKYLTQNATLSRNIKFIRLGIKGTLEDNRIRQTISDSLLPLSFMYNEHEVFAESSDSGNFSCKIFYKGRNDYMSNGYNMSHITDAVNYGFNTALTKSPSNTLRLTGTYRRLNISNATLTNAKEARSVLGRLEHHLRLFKKIISASTFYETGSGMELKKEFTYIETLAGQGIYTWTDYNENGIKELNEFDVAVFKDQGNFIRIYTPTNEYIRTYFTQFSEIINITPASLLRSKKGLAGTISKLSGIAAYKVEHKTNGAYNSNSFNPFLNKTADSTLVTLNSSFRGNIFYNRSGTGFSTEMGYQDIRNKSLLTTGFETRMLEQWDGSLRWNFIRAYTLRLALMKNHKTAYSEYFTSKDYRIMQLSGEPSLSWQPGNTFRLSFMWLYSHKENKDGENREKAFRNRLGSEIRYNISSKGSLSAKLSYINIKYSHSENSSIAYEMLEGLRKGDNITWNLSWQRNLSEFLQLSLLYDGRSAPTVKTIHTGSVQLRAFF